MQRKLLLSNKLIKNITIWFGVFIILFISSFVQAKTASLIAGFMLNENALFKSMAEDIAGFFSFFSPFINWILISSILAYFINAIQEDYEELEKKDIFLLVGYSAIILLIASLLVIFKLNNCENSEEFKQFLEWSTLLRKISSTVYYIFLVTFVSIYEKFNLKKVFMLGFVFVVIFSFSNYLLPMMNGK